jgi:gliding motility-associated-like protein
MLSKKPCSVAGKIILLLICCVFCAAGFSQSIPHEKIPLKGREFNCCGIDSIKLKKNRMAPDAIFFPQNQQQPLNHYQPLGVPSYIVSVVFHIISSNPSRITDQQIINAVQDLNDAFAHSGSYAAGAPGANTGITFCLARIDPDGGITTGITRTQSPLGDFDEDIEDDRLKGLISWDTKQYCNIWLVDSVRNEYFTTFSCGAWARKQNDSYTSFLPDGDYRDGIVTTGFGSPLATLMGTYLGLKNTFVLGSCTNSDCNTDGDGVCDTPPSSGPSTSCTGLQNSCNTDTVSGFTSDMPDLTSNFMSFLGYGYCTNSFTEGQAEKMQSVLMGARNELITQNKCNPPCAENITASFMRDNWLPAPGDIIHFTSNSSGGINYQWTVNNITVGNNGPTYMQPFVAGRYKVLLKVYNSDKNCFASYSDSVIVGCPVMARFTPDKRIVASKDQFMIDSILFTNRSVNATGYQWWISNNTGISPQIVSTGYNLNQIFHTPGVYYVWLVASNGNCSDTSEKLKINVADPTVDGTISFRDVQCYDETKVIVTFAVCNAGFDTIPAGTPVTFYDGDPRTEKANILGPGFFLSTAVPGNCCYSFNTILNIGYTGLNQLYAVFNDNGSTRPLALPNSSLIEKNYSNNIASASNFQFRASVSPSLSTLEPGDTLQLSGSGSPGSVSFYIWSYAPELSCTDCANPVFIAGRENVTEKLIAISGYACRDSALAVIKVPPADDYVISIDSLECARNDSVLAFFSVCDLFKRGFVPDGLKISFYDGDPSTDTAHLLRPVFNTTTDNQEKCVLFSQFFGQVKMGSVYAVVNDSGISAPVQLPADSLFAEKTYTNNTAGLFYQQGRLILQPADTTIYRKQSFTISILSTLSDPSSTFWDPGPGYSLSCSDCLSPTVTGLSDDFVTMHSSNQYGCLLEGKTRIQIIPPDFTANILETHCYTNDSMLVKFKICVNNDYDSIFAGLPVSFYDGTWGTGQSKLLEPTFNTIQMLPGSCGSFAAIIKAPVTGNVSLVVNDKGLDNSTIPDTAFRETNYSNNSNTFTVIPFSVSVQPSDTTVSRFTNVPLHFEVSGGQLSSYDWNPTDFLSCSNCSAPVSTPSHSLQYALEVQNEFFCTAKAYAQINTFSGGRVNIPNAFTPNGDGHNDIFYIIGSQDIKIVKKFTVFNRWGQAVFSVNNVPANDPKFGWNGLINGKPSSPDAYVYIAVIQFTDGSQQVFKGSVVLIL